MKLESNRKQNKQFMILSAIAIIFVVDAHAWGPLAVFTNFFPYNSFFMPMFVFISGYFFKKDNLDRPLYFIKKKFFKLLVPYHLILVLVFYIDEITSPFYNMLWLQDVMNPGWFVPALFGVNILWFFIRFIFKKFWNEYIATILYCIIGTWCVYLSRNGWNKTEWLPLIKICFLIQFFQLGILYKEKIQKYFEKVHVLVVFVVTILINTFLQLITQNKIYFNDLNTMSGFLTDIYILPLITSLTGISFWLGVSKVLVPILGENKLVNYISKHTFTIMMFHMVFFVMYNFLISKIPIVATNFDFEKFNSTAWYRYEPVAQMKVFYLLFGVFGPIILSFCFDKIVDKIKKKLGKNSSSKYGSVKKIILLMLRN